MVKRIGLPAALWQVLKRTAPSRRKSSGPGSRSAKAATPRIAGTGSASSSSYRSRCTGTPVRCNRPSAVLCAFHNSAARPGAYRVISCAPSASGRATVLVHE
ncbi:MAG: hypothetical protein AUI14_00930 [Actinobacteria bacterium 13_2_20CM_2_71_6]|nr:MAG: hypothetical protein AUI14_00930 [Actinobacteria bacterium 13_2_20CM_2_71_6]